MKQRLSYRFVSAAADKKRVELLLYSQIGETWLGNGVTARKFREDLKQHAGKDILVRINSPGGSVFDGMAIYHALNEHDGNVDVCVDALAASIASVIAMAGRKITIKRGAMFMVHNPWTFAMGDAEDMRKEADVLDKIRNGMVDIYVARTAAKKDKVSDLLDAETWLDADEAIALGFADSVDEAYTPAPDEDDDDEDDDERKAAMQSGDPKELLKLWNLSGVYKHCPESLTKGRDVITLNRDDPSNRMNILAQLRELVVPTVQKPVGSVAKPGDEKMETAEQRAERLARKAAGKSTPADLEIERAEVAAAATTAAPAAPAAAAPTAPAAEGDVIRRSDEKARRDQIRAAYQPFIGSHRELMDTCLEDLGCDVEQARQKLLKALAADAPSTVAGSHVTMVMDASDKFREGASKALLARAGLETPDAQNPYNSYSLREIARASLVMARKVLGGDIMTMVGMAFTTTSDFPAVLENVARKSLLKGFTEADEVFDKFTSRGQLTDFKQAKRVGLSEFSDLDEIPEHGEYKQGQFGERSEAIQLATYGKMFGLSRQAIINDDLQVFTDVPRKMGRAAKRTIGNKVFAVLTGNPLMGDGIALYAAAAPPAGHGNLLSGGASALSETSLDSARSKMALQKDVQNKQVLNVRPAYLLVPVGLEGVANRLMASETSPTQANSKLPNLVRGMATVIADARLDAASPTAWYLFANQSVHDTIEVAYLNGVDTPFMEQQIGWNIDGTMWKVRIDAAVKALEWRTQLKSAGA